MNGFLKYIVSGCILLSLNLVAAIGFGEIRLKSYLNEPLQVEIDIIDAQDVVQDFIEAGLAPLEEFEKLNISFPYILSFLKFEVVHTESTKPGQLSTSMIRITSSQSVKMPVLDFLVDLSWSEGRITKRITLFLDPKTTQDINRELAQKKQKPIEPIVAPVAKPEPKSEPKLELKSDLKPESKPESKPELKLESKSESKLEPKPAIKPEPKSEPKSEPNVLKDLSDFFKTIPTAPKLPGAELETELGSGADSDHENFFELPVVDQPKSEPKPEPKPEIKSEAKSESDIKPESKPEPKPADIKESTPEASKTIPVVVQATQSDQHDHWFAIIFWMICLIGGAGLSWMYRAQLQMFYFRNLQKWKKSDAAASDLDVNSLLTGLNDDVSKKSDASLLTERSLSLDDTFDTRMIQTPSVSEPKMPPMAPPPMPERDPDLDSVELISIHTTPSKVPAAPPPPPPPDPIREPVKLSLNTRSDELKLSDAHDPTALSIEELELRLHLAKQYIDIGDLSGAENLLQPLTQSSNKDIVVQARDLLQQISKG